MQPLLARSFLLALSLVLVGATACVASAPEDGDLGLSESLLTSSQRRTRAAQIRDAAVASGMTQGYLLAGIADAETQMSHCWSELTWACMGPYSADCGGPVVAGAGDGACSRREGGLGMFQFDAGTYDDTLRREGDRVLSIAGNVAAAVDFVAAMVVRSRYVSGVSDRAQAIEWMNGVRVGNGRWDAWISTVTHYYNGCTPSATCWSSRYARYRDHTARVRDEMGATFWDVGRCDAHCEGGTTLVGEDCGRGDCGAFGARCVDDALGARCVFGACPARGTDTFCVDDRTLGTCHDGAVGTGDCGAYGARCVDDALGARCVFGACPARGNSTVCLDETTLATCSDGAVTTGNCGAFGARCADGPEGAHCAFYACPDNGEASVCLDQRTIAHCNDGAVSTGDCGAFAAVCSTEGTDANSARCVSLFCVADPSDAPVEHDTCLPDGRIAHCDDAGSPLRPRDCRDGTACEIFTRDDGTPGARCAGPEGEDPPMPSEPEPYDPEPTDPEPTDPEPTDPEPTDPEPIAPTDPEPTGSMRGGPAASCSVSSATSSRAPLALFAVLGLAALAKRRGRSAGRS